LKFPFELKKHISCSLQLSNKTDAYVAFKVKTTNPKKYWVRPNTGIVMPRSTCDVMVTMQAQKEAPPDMQCKDKFLLQIVKTVDGASRKDITPEMFNKESGHVVEERKLRVVYVSPPQDKLAEELLKREGNKSRGGIICHWLINWLPWHNNGVPLEEDLSSSVLQFDRSFFVPDFQAIMRKVKIE
ncbi:vesicle-associated protein 1-1-like, partial [Vigna umbellata]|uniref:vesicle-associated protein 1-1-like n=1 Tax=Vigna umbellata TaxID=87088 RepID=UPI001F5E4EBC